MDVPIAPLAPVTKIRCGKSVFVCTIFNLLTGNIELEEHDRTVLAERYNRASLSYSTQCKKKSSGVKVAQTRHLSWSRVCLMPRMSLLFLSVHESALFCKIVALFSTMRRKCQGVTDIDHIRKMVQPALLRLCIALSVATVLVLLLASVPAFAWIDPGGSIFLISSVVCWGILFVFYSLRQDDPRKIVSAQGPAGDILQIATYHALPKRLQKEKP